MLSESALIDPFSADGCVGRKDGGLTAATRVIYRVTIATFRLKTGELGVKVRIKAYMGLETKTIVVS